MILDNFTLLTDEIAEGADKPEWGESGPSSRQFARIVETYERVSGGGPYISVSALRGLMMQLKRPLGYLTEDGVAKFEEKDRWEEGMIRAELNVILMEERKLRAESKKSRWNRMLASLSVEQKYLNAVKFKDVVYTLLIWRKPSLVPLYVKIGRAQRVEKVLQVSDCLVVLRFLAQVCGERMKSALQRQLKARAAFVRWTKEDPVQMRRIMYRESRRMGRLFPSSTVRVELLLLNQGFEVDDLHNESLSFAFKRINTQASITFFLQRCASDLVILKFVDPLHADKGLVTADFTECNWEGWSIKQWAKDSFLEAAANKEDRAASTTWVRIDFTMPFHVFKSGKRQVVSKYQGTLKDIHSFVVASETGKSEGSPQSSGDVHTLRLNVGTYEAPNASEVETSKVSSNKMYDAILEVVGYVGFEHETLHMSANSQKLTEMPAEGLGETGRNYA